MTHGGECRDVQAQTANLNDRLVHAESSWATQIDRMKAFEDKLLAMQSSNAPSRGRAFDDSFQKLAVVGFDSQINLELSTGYENLHGVQFSDG